MHLCSKPNPESDPSSAKNSMSSTSKIGIDVARSTVHDAKFPFFTISTPEQKFASRFSWQIENCKEKTRNYIACRSTCSYFITQSRAIRATNASVQANQPWSDLSRGNKHVTWSRMSWFSVGNLFVKQKNLGSSILLVISREEGRQCGFWPQQSFEERKTDKLKTTAPEHRTKLFEHTLILGLQLEKRDLLASDFPSKVFDCRHLRSWAKAWFPCRQLCESRQTCGALWMACSLSPARTTK